MYRIKTARRMLSGGRFFDAKAFVTNVMIVAWVRDFVSRV